MQTNNDEFVKRMKCFRKKTSGETKSFRLGKTEPIRVAIRRAKLARSFLGKRKDKNGKFRMNLPQESIFFY